MWSEDKLNELLTNPSDKLVEDVKKLKGDIMILGAGGKMGPTLAILAKNAIKKAGVDKKVIAVSRFSDPIAYKYLEDNGVEIISCDLLDVEALNALPEVENVIYMAGRKFGTDGQEYLTWAMNATLPAFVAYKFRKSNIVVFSSGNIYPIVPLSSGGCTEADKVGPIGEYAQSCLARERAFEYAANKYGTPIFIYRLNFAVDLRYGVLFDVAKRIMDGEPISLTTPCFNFIWQGTANEIAGYLGKEATFIGEEQPNAYIANAGRAVELFGYPEVSPETLFKWQAEYILDGGRTLDKPTHFEERKGSY